jgi:hypothetical protein
MILFSRNCVSSFVQNLSLQGNFYLSSIPKSKLYFFYFLRTELYGK